MTGRHRDDVRGHLRYLAVLAAVGSLVALAFHLIVAHPQRNGAQLAADSATTSRSNARTTGPTGYASIPGPIRSSADATDPSSADPPRSTAHPSRPARADAAIAELIKGHRKGSVSIAAHNPRTGVTYRYGASGGMWTASVAKLDLLETLLVKHQDAHTSLSPAEDSHAARMIENSDNAAADWIFGNAVGARSGLVAMNERLGLTNTVMGPGYYWGLTRTSANDQLTLLKHLVDPAGPLDAKSRSYALGLLGKVESDQRWGVSAAADPGTKFVNKNGWLALDDDAGLWAVNSDGIITVRGQRVLISVLTQHNKAFQPGIKLNEALSKIVAGVVAPPR